MLIRRETPADIEAVHAVTAAAFTDPADPASVPVEARLLGELRADPGWEPALSLVAEDADGAVIGHVVCTWGRLGAVAAPGLGPISVRPDHQGAGVGSALMHAVVGGADALAAPFVALLGEPAFYGRFGFVPSTDHGIEPPDPQWGRYFQVRTLSGHDPALRGTYAYAEPFSRL